MFMYLHNSSACGLWGFIDLCKDPTCTISNCGIWAKLLYFFNFLREGKGEEERGGKNRGVEGRGGLGRGEEG